MRFSFNRETDQEVCTRLVDMRAASRVNEKDATLFSFSSQAQESAFISMGWSTLASDSSEALGNVVAYVDELKRDGFTDVVLVGQGGSTQAAMVYAKLCESERGLVFHTIDYLFASTIDALLTSLPLATTSFIIASKSGMTIETLWMYSAIKERLCADLFGDDCASLPPEEQGLVGNHFTAITDSGSPLEALAREERFRAVFPGTPYVGGRFSALSVFGLLPAACAGGDIEAIVQKSARQEQLCSKDSPDNPAVLLASFLYSGLMAGRDKFSLITDLAGRVFGLWVEQLIAESLGKQGQGIVPNIEVDPTLIGPASVDRSAISFRFSSDQETHRAIEQLDDMLPVLDIVLEDPTEVGACFVVWEYATAMLGALMRIDPFSQPDVAETKRAVDFVLSGALLTPPALVLPDGSSIDYGRTLKTHMERLARDIVDPENPETVFGSLQRLFSTIKAKDYFALLSYIPFTGKRRTSLEMIRHCVAENFGIVSCLEIAPRYLHSTGQLYKGGKNNGVFLIVSAADEFDIRVEDLPPLDQHRQNEHTNHTSSTEKSLNTLLVAQARGDLAALSNHRRRVLHVHLPCWDADTIEDFAKLACDAALTQAPLA